jgi:hypothetical protein
MAGQAHHGERTDARGASRSAPYDGMMTPNSCA